MEVTEARSALLSNYEVLTLLKELESNHLERSKAAIRVKKEEDAAGLPSSLTNVLPDISENLRTIQVEAIQYLSSDYLPTTRQTPEGISKLTKDLGSYSLTKSEKLQIVNLAPTLPVELYVIVEELEDRLGDEMDNILEQVKSVLIPEDGVPQTNGINGTSTNNTITTFSSTATSLLQDPHLMDTTMNSTWDEDADAIVDDSEFVDHGEGAGIEGDLDLDDD